MGRPSTQKWKAAVINLVGAIVALILWFLLTFVTKTGLGIIHALLAIGVLLWIRWWALRYAR